LKTGTHDAAESGEKRKTATLTADWQFQWLKPDGAINEAEYRPLPDLSDARCGSELPVHLQRHAAVRRPEQKFGGAVADTRP